MLLLTCRVVLLDCIINTVCCWYNAPAHVSCGITGLHHEYRVLLV